ncbi:MAG: hypothetical protein JW849_05755, partial [Phycisphaerae bacterium]|nr:hypothetical protein [Phycisphaerae bacterium]
CPASHADPLVYCAKRPHSSKFNPLWDDCDTDFNIKNRWRYKGREKGKKMTRIIVCFLLCMILPIPFGCCGYGRSEGERRSGRYSWSRAAKPNEIQKADLLGVYTCPFTDGSSEINLRKDGTYILTVRENNGRSVTIGPYSWHAQNLDGKEPYVTLDHFPILIATMDRPVPIQGDTKKEEEFIGGGFSRIGFNKYEEIVLAIGVDPDNDYYFAKSKSSPQNGGQDKASE